MPYIHEKKHIGNPIRGFTLIEILVVFSVIAILSGVGIGAYSTYNQVQQFNQSTLNAQGLISQARGNALSVVKTVNNASGVSITCNANVLKSYYVTQASGNTLRLYMECEGVFPDQQVIDLKLLGSVVIGNAADGTTCTEVRYESLTANLLSPPCDYILKDGTRKKQLHIDSGGNISLNDL